MSTLFARSTAIIAIAAATSLGGYENYFYKLDGSNKAVLCTAVTDIPHGIIGAVTVDGLEISAIPLGGNNGTVRVKLGAAVTDLRKLLTLRADSTAESDDGAGARVFVALPLETGAADEEIECILLAPRKIAAQTQTALTDNSGGVASTTLAVIATGTPADLAAQAAINTAIRNAIASLAAELALVKADLAAVNTAV
ncbi:MAG TPA: hypothetical protein VK961_26900 [Chthoniobacter sp.]|nr:hypothetical protein [Chthoniobacter sp.]